MAGRSTVWTDPRWVEWVKENGPYHGWKTRDLHREFVREFGTGTPAQRYSSFMSFMYWCRDGGTVIPKSSARVVTDEVLNIQCEGALITSDHQIPYHDAEWMEFALEMGQAFGCSHHILNGDVFDMSTFSRFEQQLSDDGSSFEGELHVVERLLAESDKRFRATVMLYGNHEWRLLRRVLNSQLSGERFAQLLGDEVIVTELSFVVLNDRVRVTHPRAYSRIAARVGVALASKHHQDVVVAHDHQVGYARDVSGRYTVVHSGCMADPRRLTYAQTADSTAPQMSQGFVILTPGGELRLFDKANCDQEFWLWVAKRSRKGRRPVAA